MEAYYYSKMNKAQQSIYHAMKSGLTTIAPSFLVPRAEGSELQEIFFKLRLDCPEIFYAVSYRYRFHKEASHVEMIPEYLFNKKKIKEHQQAMKARITKLAIPAKGMTEQQKEQYIHDFICGAVHYDKLKKPYSHEIIGPLGQGVGVCEGIAKAVKALCDALDIWCIIAISEANPDKNIKYRHAWNVVRIGGTYYHLDVTFDNTLSSDEVTRYDYYNLGDKQFFKDHEPVLYQVPTCMNDDHFYYKEKKLSFTKMEEVRKRVPQAIRKGKPFLFHWRGGYLTREVLAELIEQLEQAAKEKDRHARISLNWPQAVLYVTFSLDRLNQGMHFEEANEGEQLTRSTEMENKEDNNAKT